MNSLAVSEFPWSGVYFKGVAVRIAAVPNPGFRFSRWSGASASSDTALSVSLDGDASFEAVFTRDGASVSDDRDAAAPSCSRSGRIFPIPSIHRRGSNSACRTGARFLCGSSTFTAGCPGSRGRAVRSRSSFGGVGRE